MASKGSILAAIVSIGVLLIPATHSALAKGGGGHSGGGGAHFGGGHAGGGAAHFRGVSGGGARVGASRIGLGHVGTARGRGSKASAGAARTGPNRFGNARTAGAAKNAKTAGGGNNAKTAGSAKNARSLSDARSGPTRAILPALLQREPKVRSPERRPGTNGAILTGSPAGADGMADGAAGMVAGVAGSDRFSGLTSSAISWPSRSGLTPISIPSGHMGIGLCWTPCSGLVPITVRPMDTVRAMMSMADTHTVVTRVVPRVVPAPTSLAQSQTKLTLPRVAVALRPA